MIKSMTGFGRGEFSNEDYHVVVELKALNHRYADISFRLPKHLIFVEEPMKKIIKEGVKRGKVEVFLTFEDLRENKTAVSVNEAVAREYVDKFRDLAKSCQLEANLDMAFLAELPDVMEVRAIEGDRDTILEAFTSASREATRSLNEMRKLEGETLKKYIQNRGRTLNSLLEEMKPLAESVPFAYKQKLEERIASLLEGYSEVSEERIATEVAIFADRANVDEELTRLESHIVQLFQILDEGEAGIGKKLDFLAQELNREANTIGSKANDLELTKLVLEMKTEIEKVREQVQNIE